MSGGGGAVRDCNDLAEWGGVKGRCGVPGWWRGRAVVCGAWVGGIRSGDGVCRSVESMYM